MNLIFLGSVFATGIFSVVSPKIVLALSFVINAIALVAFTMTKVYILLAVSRFMVGFC